MDVRAPRSSYLDEVPPRRGLDAARLRPVPADPRLLLRRARCRQVDTCPRVLARRVEVAEGEVVLTKCCLLEEHIETERNWSSCRGAPRSSHLREALSRVAGVAAAEAPDT